jgi:hypothetical protein
MGGSKMKCLNAIKLIKDEIRIHESEKRKAANELDKWKGSQLLFYRHKYTSIGLQKALEIVKGEK